MSRRLIIITILGFLIGHLTFGQEAKFKALFLVKFTQYIEWPQGNSNLTIGILGNPTVMEELQKFSAQMGNIEVIDVKSTADASKCNMLFFASGKAKNVQEYVAALGSSSVLIVSDNSDQVGKGADIGFFLEESKLRFLISKGTIESKEMVPSSKLLTLGKAI